MGLPLGSARSIRVEERDAELDLGRREWPKGISTPNTWTPDADSGLLYRSIGGKESEGELVHPLKERVLRFPSAQIHGLHRLSQEHVNMGPVESFHTYRLLSDPRRRKRVSRIFLMHNGLNETRKMGLYYQLASYLIKQDKGTVCILRPFPGHLTRCAVPGLSETPLDHYLWDGLHLFRQFLRYMIETRWLLSAIARHSYYHCASGSGLLGQSKVLKDSRLDPDFLAAEMLEEWKLLHEASEAAIDRGKDKSPPMRRRPPAQAAFKQAITSLRGALGLDHYPESDGGSFDPDADPELHAIGYSLGGFAAQSVFMSWPFLVSSCSTLLSGGAMRELAPTSFADPEEWQTVLHSLRYELDDALMDRRFTQSQDDQRVAGVDPFLFLYLKRAFYEVFQQEYRGSFQTRLVAFRQRMLFVVGGNDPIVRPQSVLDAGPPDGINMLAVGGLGHFLDNSPTGQVEKEQRSFWLPEIGQIIGRLASDAAARHRSDLESTWLNEEDLLPEPDTDGEEDSPPEAGESQEKAEESQGRLRLSIAERLEVERDGTLPNHLFQRSLDDLLARAAAGEGLLFILKNEVPTFLLDERALQQHAAALYHEDIGIAKYVQEVRSRRKLIKAARKRICVVLPWNVETIMRRIDARLRHPSQSEGSGEQGVESHDAETSWNDLLDRWSEWTKEPHRNALRVFDGRDGVDLATEPSLDVSDLSAAARQRLGISDRKRAVKPALPDCWVWMSNEFLGSSKDDALTIEFGRQRLCDKVPPYVQKSRGPEENRRLEKRISARLRKDDLRIVTVSRARYNPRFRGRIIAEPKQAQELLLQVALCVVSSVPLERFDFKRQKAVRSRPRR